MTAIDETKRIAENVLGCQFFQGTPNELNQEIEKELIQKDKWVFGFISPESISDQINDGLISTTLPFTAYVVKHVESESNEYRTALMQPLIEDALKKARKFVHDFNNLDIVGKATTKVDYPTAYAKNDLHLFGVGIVCEFVIEEGLTGCEI